MVNDVATQRTFFGAHAMTNTKSLADLEQEVFDTWERWTVFRHPKRGGPRGPRGYYTFTAFWKALERWLKAKRKQQVKRPPQ